jgi:hypothetical protein
MSFKINITPTIFLNGVTLFSIKEKLARGDFTVEKKKTNFQIQRTIKTLNQQISLKNDASMYKIPNVINNKIVCTTGCTNFEICNKEGNLTKEGGRCGYCLDDFKTISVGVPIAFEQVNYENAHEKKTIFIFWLEGTFCTFECVYKFLLDSKLYSEENIILLKKMFLTVFPTGKFMPANDRLLLKSNGGSLEREQWEVPHNLFIAKNEIIFYPVKREYNSI